MMRYRKLFSRALSYLLKVLMVLPFMIPFYIAFIYAFKSKMEITFTGIAFPNPMRWENFPQAIKVTNFWNALINSLITTVPVVVMLTIFCSMGAYIVARRNTGFYNFVYYTMVGAMLIPFQVIMTPLYLDLKNFGLINTLLGFILTRTGFQIAFSLLLMTGFVKNVPLEIEESANIDGAGKYKTLADNLSADAPDHFYNPHSQYPVYVE